jgi:hypothetical protein
MIRPLNLLPRLLSTVIILVLIVVFTGPSNAEEITKPSFKKACGRIIRAHGYQCPQANIVWNKGIKPIGLEIKVWCGPRGSDDVYADLVYRIYMDPNDGHFIALEPWD